MIAILERVPGGVLSFQQVPGEDLLDELLADLNAGDETGHTRIISVWQDEEVETAKEEFRRLTA